MSLSFPYSGPIQRKMASGAAIYIFSLGKAVIHSYVSPDKAFNDASHIIETENQLIIVDAQYSKPSAQELRRYAETLGKPIRGIFVSHAHPDHYLGLAEFADIPSFALRSTIDQISETGVAALEESKELIGAASVDMLVIPSTPLPTGLMENDGLEYKLTEVSNAESKTQLIIEIPSIDVIIVQDLVYNGAHPYISGKVDDWIKILMALKNTPERFVFVGHGHPATPEVYDGMIKYLTKAQEIYEESSTPEEYKQTLLGHFPNYRGVMVIDLYLKDLYPK